MKLHFLTTLLTFGTLSATKAWKTGLRRSLQDGCAGDHDHDCDGVPDHDDATHEDDDHDHDDHDSHDDHGGSNPDGCFSKLVSVDVQGKGAVKMADLNVGDFVRVSKDSFSQVFSFAHLAPDVDGEFLQIYWDATEEPIELTPRHMLFVNGNPVRADSVKPGDRLSDDKIVTDIASVNRKGLFAPITTTGEIMVNGIKASTYVAMMDHVPLNQHYLVHMFFAPQRALCGMNFAWCEQETYTADGYSNWSNWAVQLYILANNASAPVQWLLTACAGVILPMGYTTEQFFVSPLLALATIGLLGYKATTKKTKLA